MYSWNHHNPVNIIYGCGSRKFLIESLKNLKTLVVTTVRGRKFLENDSILSEITKNSYFIESIKSNPSLLSLQEEINKIPSKNFDSILAFGGGSCIDAAKAISAALGKSNFNANLSDLIKNTNNYFNQPLVPIYAVPTTAGTGSEVTPFATIWDHVNQKKLSIQHKYLYPKIAM